MSVLSSAHSATLRSSTSGADRWFDADRSADAAPYPTTVRAAEAPPLVMRCGAFGDMVLLTVLLQQLHARFGKPVDVISSGPWTRPLLEGHAAVGRLFLIRSRRTPYWFSPDQHDLVTKLRERGAGPTWFCDLGAGRDLLRRAGIPDDYICDSTSYPWAPGEGFADRYLRLGNVTPTAFEGLLPPAKPGVSRAARVHIAGPARRELEYWLSRCGLAGRPYLIIHPGSRHVARRWIRPRSGTNKYWPEEHWAEVVRAVRETARDHAILFSGTGAERRLNAQIMRLAGVADTHNIAGEVSIRMLLPLLERADSMISVDTGPAHAAAALGCPTVALFGTADPILYRPGGAVTPAVSLTGQVDGVPSMMGITPEQVIRGWLDLIHPASPPEVDSVKFVSR
jgi:ADP-heptose:LPS heptosyltransferase